MTNPTPAKKGFRRSGNSELHSAAIQKLQAASSKEKDEVIAMLESDEAGISQQSAEERISQYGLNEVQYDKPPSWFVQLIRSFLNPDRKSTRLNSSHVAISYAVFCLKKKKKND